MTFSAVKKMGDRKIPTLMELEPQKEEGRKTTLKIIELEFNVPIDDSVFTLRNLKTER